MVTSEEQLHTACEETRFVRTISQGLFHKTFEDVDDGLRNFIASRRGYTFSQTHPDSDAVVLWRNATCSGATRIVHVCVLRDMSVHGAHSAS